jgi:fluoride exporter
VKKYLFIAMGGMLGAITRYGIKEIRMIGYQGAFPLNTFLINITGSFILAAILTLAFAKQGFDENLKLGITTGFLGAYTTFSSFCKETILLFSTGHIMMAGYYIFSSTFAGLLAAYVGVAFCRRVLQARLLRR